MKKAVKRLRWAGIDAFIDHERLYFRDADGGIGELHNSSYVDYVLFRATVNPAFYVTLK